MPVPKDKKGVQRLLGMCNFLSQFVPKLSKMCAPLREINNMNTAFSWSASKQIAFTHLKEMITNAPVLQYFDSAKPVIQQVDAADDGLGGVPMQSKRPVAALRLP